MSSKLRRHNSNNGLLNSQTSLTWEKAAAEAIKEKNTASFMVGCVDVDDANLSRK
jgi:hypothetical protein